MAVVGRAIVAGGMVGPVLLMLGLTGMLATVGPVTISARSAP